METYSNYIPVHSDFIIHWTGKDIDYDHQNCWDQDHSSITYPEVTRLYLERLKSILNFGLWMTQDINDDKINIKNNGYNRPSHARICFTELKLSQARFHAKNYGRLGIGFKRTFLYDRLGAPMIYYFNKDIFDNWISPNLQDKSDYSEFDYYSCFIKHMAEKSEGPSETLQYKKFDESEWRIIFSERIKEFLKQKGYEEISKKFKTFNEIENEMLNKKNTNNRDIDLMRIKKLKEMINNSKTKPEYFIPVQEAWLNVIIYPSIQVKVEAQGDEEIRAIINSIKNNSIVKNPISSYGYPGDWEKYNLPIELDLDACRNF